MASEGAMVRHQGWLHKRIPRPKDSDKKSLKRSALGFTKLFKNKYQKRWFDLQPENERLVYFKSKPSSDSNVPAGMVSLAAIHSVSRGPCATLGEERAPTEWVLNIHTHDRIFTLAAESRAERDIWVDSLLAVLENNGVIESAAEEAEEVGPTKNHRAAVMDVVDLAYEKRVIPKTEASKLLILEAMNANMLFKQCKKAEKLDLLDAFESINVPAGTKVITQGEKGDHFYIVETGAVDVYLNQPTGQPKKFGDSLVSGASFGELALMYNTPRAATIQVCDDAMLWRIDRKTVRSTIAHFQTLRAQQYCDFLRVVQFEGKALGDILHPDQLQRLAGALDSEEYPAGHVIIREGEHGDFFYIIEDGNVDVFKAQSPDQIGVVSDEMKVATLPVGRYFGEKALISQDRRAATCVASSAGCRCLMLNRDDFNMMLGNLTDLLAGKNDALAGNEQAAETVEEEEFELCELDTLKTLGFGAFGVVRMVQHKVTKKPFALKCLSKAGILKHGLQEHTIRERQLMRKMNHPFVLKLHGAMKDDRFIYFVLQLLIGGELFTHLEKKGALKEKEARFYAAQVQQAFQHIHSHRIAYRDLKPENLVLDDKGYITVVDFGLAKIVDGKTFTVCGTPDYLAPEIILNEGHDKGVDYWALGVFIYELVMTEPPFACDDPMQTYKRIIDRDFSIPKKMSTELSNLIRHLLRSQGKRLGNGKEGCAAIAKHKWFAGFDFNALLQQTLPPPIPVVVTDPLDASNFDDYDEEEEGFTLPPVCRDWDPDLTA